MTYKFPLEKLEIPDLGGEHFVDKMKVTSVDDKERAIVDTVNKINEVVDQINNIYEHLHRL